MTKREIVNQYMDGFREGDQSKVLAYLADDVIWRSHGCQTIKGKAAFSADITNEEFSNTPKIEIHQYIEEGDHLVAIGSGVFATEGNGGRGFNFCEVFLFQGDLICEIDTFHIWNASVF